MLRTRRRAAARQRLSSREVIASLMNIRRSTEREGAMKSNGSDNLRSNPECGMLTRGEPVAVKAARRVRRGEWGDVSNGQRALLLPYEADTGARDIALPSEY